MGHWLAMTTLEPRTIGQASRKRCFWEFARIVGARCPEYQHHSTTYSIKYNGGEATHYKLGARPLATVFFSSSMVLPTRLEFASLSDQSGPKEATIKAGYAWPVPGGALILLFSYRGGRKPNLMAIGSETLLHYNGI